MRHFPIFVDMTGQRIVVSGGGEAAVAKLRLLLKTPARIEVFAAAPCAEVEAWAEDKLTLHRQALEAGDAQGARLFYAANDDDAEDARVAAIARAEGVLVNSVDNLQASQFITPAIVDRAPLTIAIGTEGAAPVLARRLKAELEARLSPAIGRLARLGQRFRRRAEALPMGRVRREFWAEYYDTEGPRALESGGEAAVRATLDDLLQRHLGRTRSAGHVDLVGAGPGDPELLTLRARKALDRADVVIHDRLVAPEILELARREAQIIAVGKEGFGPSVPQSEIDALLVEHARAGAHVVRLKSGDPTVFGRLDEEIEACEAAGIAWRIVPGITAASSAVAAIGQSLTRRGRNGSVRFLTGHDMKGFAEQDWRSLATGTEVAAIYMGKAAARFVQGRLLMHGADAGTPLSLIENASRSDERIIGTTLSQLSETVAEADFAGPVLMFLGLSPRQAAHALPARTTHNHPATSLKEAAI
jgi:uroporphyrin-III C-methyltransferase/precorrin-2 dehydrogenase/sirohydrochlorin ferrochelatase